MGRSGAALALLLPSESAYVELLRMRKVPLTEGRKMDGGWLGAAASLLFCHLQERRDAARAALQAAAAPPFGIPQGCARRLARARSLAAAACARRPSLRLLPDLAAAGAPEGLAAWLRKEAETDREAMEKATRAFVSFVRGYKEHHLKYIFRIQVGCSVLQSHIVT